MPRQMVRGFKETSELASSSNFLVYRRTDARLYLKQPASFSLLAGVLFPGNEQKGWYGLDEEKEPIADNIRSGVDRGRRALLFRLFELIQ